MEIVFHLTTSIEDLESCLVAFNNSNNYNHLKWSRMQHSGRNTLRQRPEVWTQLGDIFKELAEAGWAK